MMALVPVLVHDASRLTLVVEQLTLYDLCNNPQSMSMTVRSTNPGFLPLKFHRATVRVDTIGLPHDGPIAILHTPVDVPLGTAIRTINASLTITDEKRASALLQQALDEDGAPYDLLMTVVKINGFKLPFPTSSIPDNSAVNMSVASRAYDSPLLMAAHQLGLNGDGGILGQGVFHMMPQNALCQVLPGLSVNITIGNATSPIPLSGYPANLCRPGPVLSTLNYTISNDNLPIAREMIAAGMVGGNFSAVFTGGGGNTSCLVQRIFNGVRSHRTLRLEARGGNPDRALGEMLSKASLDIAVQPDGKPIHFPCFLWCYGPNETSIQRDFPSSAPTPSFRIPMHVNGTITNQLPFSLSGIDSATLAFSEYNHTFGHVTLGPLPPAKAHGDRKSVV